MFTELQTLFATGRAIQASRLTGAMVLVPAEDVTNICKACLRTQKVSEARGMDSASSRSALWSKGADRKVEWRQRGKEAFLGRGGQFGEGLGSVVL